MATAKNTGVNLSGTMSDLEDIDVRVKALESTFGLKGQINIEMVLANHSGNKPTWNGRIYLLDGRKEIATANGNNFPGVINRLCKDAWTALKKDYGPTATGTTGTGQTRRTA